MKQITFWKALEYTCRVLGISTGAVLIGIGTETWLQGQFRSLAVYLLISGIAVSLYEGAYFASLLLAICFIPKKGSMMHSFWKQARYRGAFQKFLGYALLSVACFLHPVLIWHVTIPGTMLVITGFVNFLLSKQHKETMINGQQTQYRDPQCIVGGVVGEEDTGQTGTFLNRTNRGQHRSFVEQLRRFFKNCKKQEACTSSSSILSPTRQVLFKEKKVNIVFSIKENLEEQENLAEDTSDTAPILSPQL